MSLKKSMKYLYPQNESLLIVHSKLSNDFRINGAALCQFYMSCLQKFSQQNISSLFKQDIKAKQKHSIQFFAKQNLRLPLPQQQAPSMNPELDPCVDKPYNLSFSQQYASYYSPQISDGLKQVNFSRKNLKQGELNEWGEKESSVLRVRDSLTFFKQRDREIDQKLKRYGAGGRGEGMDGLGKQNRSKPQGWESFVRSNEVAKKRLINKGYREVEV